MSRLVVQINIKHSGCRIKFAIAFFISIISLSSFSQEKKFILSGDFNDIPFIQFADTVETITGVKIFYRYEWVKNILVSVKGPEIPISGVFDDVAKKHDLKYYVLNENSFIFYKGDSITDDLPDYIIISNNNDPVPAQNQAEELTEAQEKYIEGKKTAEPDLVTIGDKNSSVKGHTYKVRGRITEKESGEPVIGATIFIKALELGVVTDADGFFNLSVKQGRYFVEVNSLSLKGINLFMEVYSDGQMNIAMERDVFSINEVKVIAGQNDNVQGMQMGYVHLSSKSIKEIPVVMGEKDLLKVAMMMPGVQNAGEGSSGLIIRSGTADQNLFLINKLPVYNTSHLFGFFSAFNSDIISDFSMYKSNIPAKYGSRVSSVVDITTRQGNKKEFFGKGGISLISDHIAVEGPVVKDKGSFVVSYRGSYSDWILSRISDNNIKNSEASFYDLSSSLSFEIDEKNIIKGYFYRSNDRFSLASSDDYAYSNTGGTLNWKHTFNSAFSADFSAIFSRYALGHASKGNLSTAYKHDYILNHAELSSDFLYLTSNNHRISFGGNIIHYNLKRGEILPYDNISSLVPVDLGIEKAIEGAFFISDEFSLTPQLTLYAGLRTSYYSLFGPATINNYFSGAAYSEVNIKDTLRYNLGEIIKFYAGLEPRVALNQGLGNNNSIKLSYNRNKQYIFLLSNTVAISPSDQWKLSDYYIKPPLTDQISLGYYQNFPDRGITASMELYYKLTRNVVEYKDGIDFISSDPTEMLLLQGRQKSSGIEFLLKKNAGRFTGWISYTYSKSSVLVKSSIPTEQINQGKEFLSNYNIPHSLNLVANLRANRRISLSSNVVYSTGRPVTYPIALYYIDDQQVVYYSDRNKYRLPDYFRIDLSINFEGNLNSKKWIHSQWMVNIYNITGRKNAYSVYFESDEGEIKGYKLSIYAQPFITLSWNFKFGNYASD